jgi:hypothetical protein
MLFHKMDNEKLLLVPQVNMNNMRTSVSNNKFFDILFINGSYKEVTLNKFYQPKTFDEGEFKT